MARNCSFLFCHLSRDWADLSEQIFYHKVSTRVREQNISIENLILYLLVRENGFRELFINQVLGVIYYSWIPFFNVSVPVFAMRDSNQYQLSGLNLSVVTLICNNHVDSWEISKLFQKVIKQVGLLQVTSRKGVLYFLYGRPNLRKSGIYKNFYTNLKKSGRYDKI